MPNSERSAQMVFDRRKLLDVLKRLDLGASVAEVDDILYEARVETSTFWDLYKDSVDLVPGAKGSGKSALFRLFVKYLQVPLLEQRKVVLAHGVEAQGDNVFHLFTEKFEKLSDTQFHNFWYIYFVSLVDEVLLKNPRYKSLLTNCEEEIRTFRTQCARARIPEIKAPQSLKSVIEWGLNAVRKWLPSRASVPLDTTGQLTLNLGWEESDKSESEKEGEGQTPLYINDIRLALSQLLKKADLTVWLMLDKLDEIFPRWSQIEKRGLSTLLRAMYTFRDDRIRIKIFLREDIFEHLTSGPAGFPGLTHVGARMTSSLNWKIEDILHLIVKRVFASDEVSTLCEVDRERMEANQQYRESCFYTAFPRQVHKGSRRSPTLTWIYNRCQDGKKVVTPRDVVDLLLLARSAEIESLQSNTEGTSDCLFSPASIESGFKKMSCRKRDLFLRAEFPHFSEEILSFENGPAIYSEVYLRNKFGKKAQDIIERLVQIGFLARQLGEKKNGGYTYCIPFLYRPAFSIRQSRAH